MAQAVPVNVERSISNDDAQNRASIFFLSVHGPQIFLQLEGTACSSMMTDLVEQYTTPDGHIDGEDDIAASAAITYAGTSSYAIFPSRFNIVIPHFRWLRYGKLWSFSVISKAMLTSSSADSLRNHLFYIGSCVVSRSADARTGRARPCGWP